MPVSVLSYAFLNFHLETMMLVLKIAVQDALTTVDPIKLKILYNELPVYIKSCHKWK